MHDVDLLLVNQRPQPRTRLALSKGALDAGKVQVVSPSRQLPCSSRQLPIPRCHENRCDALRKCLEEGDQALLRAPQSRERVQVEDAEGLLARDPAMVLDSPRRWRTLPRVPTVEEMDRLLTGISDDSARGRRDLALFETLYATGARVGEILGARIQDYQPDLKVLRVMGKGSKERHGKHRIPDRQSGIL